MSNVTALHPGRPQFDEDDEAPKVKGDRQVAAFQSLRAYRQFLDRVALQCYQGHRPMSDLVKAAAFTKVGTEIFLAEGQLARAGLDKQVEHELGPDGGLGDTITPRGYLERTVKRKTGVGRHGQDIEETVYSVTGAANSDDLQEALKEIADVL